MRLARPVALPEDLKVLMDYIVEVEIAPTLELLERLKDRAVNIAIFAAAVDAMKSLERAKAAVSAYREISIDDLEKSERSAQN